VRACVAAVIVLALGACAGAPPAPPAPKASSGRSLAAGTIGAVVEPAEGGVRIKALNPEGPAVQAGLRTGDLIVRYNGTALKDALDFNRRVMRSRPGSVARLSLQRGTQAISAEVEVKQLRTAVQL
jgi:S1-C subfamily serine protease